MRFMPLKHLALIAAAGAVAGCASMGKEWPREFEDLCEISRDEEPAGLSAISLGRNGRYYCVDDRGGMLHEAEIKLAEGNDDGTFTVLRSVKLVGRVDLEGCACDPLTGWVWVSDEHDTSIRAYDPSTGRQVAALAIPDVYRRNVRKYHSFEGLAISPDGLRLYTANEENLKCDATNVVRIQEFARKGADDAFRPSRQFFYSVDPAGGAAFGKRTFSGVSSLIAMPDGSLLVLEREFSLKLLPSFRIRIYSVVPGAPGKSLVWEESSTFSNYEGMCLGPRLPDGRQSIVLVSDGGAGALETVLVLALSPTGE